MGLHGFCCFHSVKNQRKEHLKKISLILFQISLVAYGEDILHVQKGALDSLCLKKTEHEKQWL